MTKASNLNKKVWRFFLRIQGKNVPAGAGEDGILPMTDERKPVLALFYCQNVPESDEKMRQDLEKKYGRGLRLFPLPCGGRMDSLPLLKALEDFADAAYIITCPEGMCRYFEGNKWAKKRLETARTLIESIGLEKKRLELFAGSREEPKTLSSFIPEIMKHFSRLPPSPVHKIRRRA